MIESDCNLLERLRRGDGVAFEAIFLRHYVYVYRVLYGLVRAREHAEDLAQETFLELYRNPPQLKDDAQGSLLAWLYRVALNRGYNALRGDDRERLRMEKVVDNTQSNDPAVEVLRAEESSSVRHVLAQLPERQSRLLLLRYAGLSYAECAAVLGVSPGSVGTLLVRAEKAFREMYRLYNREDQPDLLERTAK